ncbi:hypothetical protein F5Y12DRAFT_747297 [Xylaria sp. FL1777]|nr:hypothetical protein F5Y12DRAFT_747297 [Xylaria sp. FL1777]
MPACLVLVLLLRDSPHFVGLPLRLICISCGRPATLYLPTCPAYTVVEIRNSQIPKFPLIYLGIYLPAYPTVGGQPLLYLYYLSRYLSNTT